MRQYRGYAKCVLAVALAAVVGLGCRAAAREGSQTPTAPPDTMASLPSSVAAGAASAAAAGAIAATPRSAISLNEIGPLPASGEPPWVELINRGAEPVEIKGWRLVGAGGGAYVLPETVPPVPPGGIVLVVFGTSDKLRPDDTFGDDKRVIVCDESGASAAAFRGATGECAVFTAEGADAASIVDYAAWGEAGQPARGASTTAATAAGIWSEYRAIARTVTGGAPGDPPGLEAGGSIGTTMGPVERPGWGGWLLYRADDATPGRPNTLPGPLLFNPAKSVSEDGPGGLAWGWSIPFTPEYEDWQEHLQVATDPELRNIIVDKVGGMSAPYWPGLGVGRYWWRVREEHGTEATAWSETGRIEVTPAPR